jgi:hypothetical protein
MFLEAPCSTSPRVESQRFVNLGLTLNLPFIFITDITQNLGDHYDVCNERSRACSKDYGIGPIPPASCVTRQLVGEVEQGASKNIRHTE